MNPILEVASKLPSRFETKEYMEESSRFFNMGHNIVLHLRLKHGDLNGMAWYLLEERLSLEPNDLKDVQKFYSEAHGVETDDVTRAVLAYSLADATQLKNFDPNVIAESKKEISDYLHKIHDETGKILTLSIPQAIKAQVVFGYSEEYISDAKSALTSKWNLFKSEKEVENLIKKYDKSKGFSAEVKSDLLKKLSPLMSNMDVGAIPEVIGNMPIVTETAQKYKIRDGGKKLFPGDSLLVDLEPFHAFSSLLYKLY